jgi:hypothetical protein
VNSSTTTNDEVASYAAAVRAAFADLEPDAREELLEDLEDHLREVAAEGEGSLADKLGPAATYAEELRTAAGLPPKATGELKRSLRAYVAGTAGAQWMRTAWAATTAHPAGRAVLAFLPDLRPAWWVLRGYLAVQLPCAMLIGMQSFPIPASWAAGSSGWSP